MSNRHSYERYEIPDIKVRGLCPKCKKSVIIDGWVCPCCGYDSSGEEELYKYGD